MQPINYMLDVAQPVQMALAGYAQGQGLRAQQQGMEQQRRLMEMQEAQFQQQQQALQQQQARAQEMQMDMANYAQAVAENRVRPQDIVQLTTKYPEMAENIQNNWNMLSEAQKSAKVDDYARMISALKTDPEIAMSMLDERIMAAENAGDPQQVNLLKSIKTQAQIDPSSVMAPLLAELSLNMDPKQFEQYMMTVQPPAQAAASPAGKILSDYEAGKFGPVGSPEAMQIRDQQLERTGAATTVNVPINMPSKLPTPRPGEALVPDPDRPGEYMAIPIAGGALEEERKRTVDNADRTIATLTEFITDPAVKSRYGIRLPVAVPGTAAADAQALVDQVKGQLFLQAYESLKGGGQITEVEGRQATAAMSRLQDQNIRYETAVKSAQTLLEIAQKARNRALGVEPWPPEGEGPPTVTTDEQYDALPSGTIYFDDEGKRRRKP